MFYRFLLVPHSQSVWGTIFQSIGLASAVSVALPTSSATLLYAQVY